MRGCSLPRRPPDRQIPDMDGTAVMCQYHDALHPCCALESTMTVHLLRTIARRIALPSHHDVGLGSPWNFHQSVLTSPVINQPTDHHFVIGHRSAANAPPFLGCQTQIFRRQRGETQQRISFIPSVLVGLHIPMVQYFDSVQSSPQSPFDLWPCATLTPK